MIDVLNVMEQIDNLFSLPFEDFKIPSCVTYATPSFPPSDIRIKKDGNIEFKFALAGYTKDELKIDYKDNRLILSTSDKYNKDYNKLEDGDRIISSNLKHSNFSYSYFLPETKFNITELTAEFKEGILFISVPLKEEEKNKKMNLLIK